MASKIPKIGPLSPSNPYAPLNQLPVVGPWIGRMGAIHEIFATPCSITPQIWVKAAFSAAPALINIVATPFPIASTFRSLQNKGRCSPKFPMRKGVEMGDGGALAREFVWHVFEVLSEFILKIEWYFFIADKVTEFEYNWVSMAYAYAGCKNKDQYWIEGTMNSDLIITNGTWQLTGPYNTIDSLGQTGQSGTLAAPSGFSGVFKGQISMTGKQFLLIPKGTDYEVAYQATGPGYNPTPEQAYPKADGGMLAATVATLGESQFESPSYGLYINGSLGAWTDISASIGLYAFPTGTNGLGVANPNIMYGR